MSPDEGGDPACWLHLFDDPDADPAPEPDDDPASEPDDDAEPADADDDAEPGGNFGVG